MASGIPAGLTEQFEALAVRKLARAAFAEHGKKLSRYPGSRLDELRAALARQDKEIIKLAQKQLHWKVHAGRETALREWCRQEVHMDGDGLNR